MAAPETWVDGDRLTVILTTDVGDLFRASLGMAAMAALYNDSEIVRFYWQPPADDEDSDLPPRQFARLVIEPIQPLVDPSV